MRLGYWMYEIEVYSMHQKGQVDDHTLNVMIRWNSIRRYKARKRSYGH